MPHFPMNNGAIINKIIDLSELLINEFNDASLKKTAITIQSLANDLESRSSFRSIANQQQ